MDGNKNRRWRPGDNHEQEFAYDGYKHAHVWAILVICDVFGRFIWLEMTDKGAESDRTLYTESDVYRNSDQYLSLGHHGMADMAFAGVGELVVPFKTNESTSWMYRTEYNSTLRKQPMVNEWGTGFLNNRFRLFLGRWPLEKGLLPVAYKTAAMVVN